MAQYRNGGGGGGGRRRESRDRRRGDSREDRGGGGGGRGDGHRGEKQGYYRDVRPDWRGGGQDRRGGGSDRRGNDDKYDRRDRSRSRDRQNKWSPRRAANVEGDGKRRERSKTPQKKPEKKPVKQKKKSESSSSSASSKSGSGNSSNEDEIIHFDWKAGQIFSDGRYELQKLMGDGTFGRVVSALDRKTNKEVAVKIIRDVKRYMENAKIEADILKDIRKTDPDGTSGCCIMYETFTHEKKFYCLVFEPLGTSLYDFLKANDFRGYWMQDIQVFCQQSMRALAFLHDRLKLTHTDLKPENVLLSSRSKAQPSDFPRQAAWFKQKGISSSHKGSQYLRPASNDIKIIDFGNATYESEHHSSIINTRQYRGPEVLLEAGWNERSDMWSIGCILMELYSGDQLFATHEELEHMALMERIIGRLPSDMLNNAAREVKDRYLHKSSSSGQWRLPWPEKASSSSSERHVHSQKSLLEQVPHPHKAFAEFLRGLLALQPHRRPSAAEAMRDPFFNERYND